MPSVVHGCHRPCSRLTFVLRVRIGLSLPQRAYRNSDIGCSVPSLLSNVTSHWGGSMCLEANASARGHLCADPAVRVRPHDFLSSQTVKPKDAVQMVWLWEYPSVSTARSRGTTGTHNLIQLTRPAGTEGYTREPNGRPRRHPDLRCLWFARLPEGEPDPSD